jgi:predicted alpha/beta hydrolase
MKHQKFDIDLGAYSCKVHHFGTGTNQPCVIMIHGSIENARVFYSKSGKGFAPWLALQGFDVYAIDLPGKGESEPKVSRKFQHSQTQFILRDMPQIVAAIVTRNTSGQLHFVTHSWGGVLVPAFIARHEIAVKSMVFFASKRRIGIFSLKRLLMVDLVWTLAGTLFSLLFGYLPARWMKIGSDNEPKSFFLQTNQWVYSKRWIDPLDGFDYHAAFNSKPVPPTLFLTGIKDDVLGHPLDVERLMNEMPNPLHELKILSKNFGNAHDYGHISILTHHHASEDHFADALIWLQKF